MLTTVCFGFFSFANETPEFKMREQENSIAIRIFGAMVSIL
jgi:hypothetical protein